MSTGDQTEYLRSKMAERGNAKTPNFSRDGFNAWAESERPARSGGSEKIPAEKQMMPSRIVGGVRYHQASDLKGGIGVEDFVKLVPGLFDFFSKVKTYTADVKEDLRGEEMPVKFQPTARAIANTLEMIGLGKKPHQALYESCMMHMAPKGKRGGAADWQSWFKELGDKLKKAYEWFVKNKAGIHYILNMKSLNPPGFDYPKQLSGLMKSIGMAKPPSASLLNKAAATAPVGGRKCGCRGGNEGVRIVDDTPEAKRLKEQYERKLANATSKEEERKLTNEYFSKMNILIKRNERAPPPDGMAYFDEEVSMADEYNRRGGKRPSVRAQIVKQVMQQQGLSLPMASKYVKEHGLY